ncbi:hypothetical protein BC937DRAFT_88684 [Endogone sp. FLAS-F59071]|nr:hypothetical protein BC937DRAFT_88684 [Endogone sp. FLAS-F59071]|eukprot:RUS23296.1 hypothetical protein BC937DRAFT_88684 [Endogone sp. FLAS-F59071]
MDPDKRKPTRLPRPDVCFLFPICRRAARFAVGSQFSRLTHPAAVVAPLGSPCLRRFTPPTAPAQAAGGPMSARAKPEPSSLKSKSQNVRASTRSAPPERRESAGIPAPTHTIRLPRTRGDSMNSPPSSAGSTAPKEIRSVRTPQEPAAQKRSLSSINGPKREVRKQRPADITIPKPEIAQKRVPSPTLLRTTRQDLTGKRTPTPTSRSTRFTDPRTPTPTSARSTKFTEVRTPTPTSVRSTKFKEARTPTPTSARSTKFMDVRTPTPTSARSTKFKDVQTPTPTSARSTKFKDVQTPTPTSARSTKFSEARPTPGRSTKLVEKRIPVVPTLARSTKVAPADKRMPVPTRTLKQKESRSTRVPPEEPEKRSITHLSQKESKSARIFPRKEETEKRTSLPKQHTTEKIPLARAPRLADLQKDIPRSATNSPQPEEAQKRLPRLGLSFGFRRTSLPSPNSPIAPTATRTSIKPTAEVEGTISRKIATDQRRKATPIDSGDYDDQTTTRAQSRQSKASSLNMFYDPGSIEAGEQERSKAVTPTRANFASAIATSNAKSQDEIQIKTVSPPTRPRSLSRPKPFEAESNDNEIRTKLVAPLARPRTLSRPKTYEPELGDDEVRAKSATPPLRPRALSRPKTYKAESSDDEILTKLTTPPIRPHTLSRPKSFEAGFDDNEIQTKSATPPIRPRTLSRLEPEFGNDEPLSKGAADHTTSRIQSVSALSSLADDLEVDNGNVSTNIAEVQAADVSMLMLPSVSYIQTIRSWEEYGDEFGDDILNSPAVEQLLEVSVSEITNGTPKNVVAEQKPIRSSTLDDIAVREGDVSITIADIGNAKATPLISPSVSYNRIICSWEEFGEDILKSPEVEQPVPSLTSAIEKLASMSIVVIEGDNSVFIADLESEQALSLLSRSESYDLAICGQHIDNDILDDSNLEKSEGSLPAIDDNVLDNVEMERTPRASPTMSPMVTATTVSHVAEVKADLPTSSTTNPSLTLSDANVDDDLTPKSSPSMQPSGPSTFAIKNMDAQEITSDKLMTEQLPIRSISPIAALASTTSDTEVNGNATSDETTEQLADISGSSLQAIGHAEIGDVPENIFAMESRQDKTEPIVATALKIEESGPIFTTAAKLDEKDKLVDEVIPGHYIIVEKCQEESQLMPASVAEHDADLDSMKKDVTLYSSFVLEQQLFGSETTLPVVAAHNIDIELNDIVTSVDILKERSPVPLTGNGTVDDNVYKSITVEHQASESRLESSNETESSAVNVLVDADIVTNVMERSPSSAQQPSPIKTEVHADTEMHEDVIDGIEAEQLSNPSDQIVKEESRGIPVALETVLSNDAFSNDNSAEQVSAAHPSITVAIDEEVYDEIADESSNVSLTMPSIPTLNGGISDDKSVKQVPTASLPIIKLNDDVLQEIAIEQMITTLEPVLLTVTSDEDTPIDDPVEQVATEALNLPVSLSSDNDPDVIAVLEAISLVPEIEPARISLAVNRSISVESSGDILQEAQVDKPQEPSEKDGGHVEQTNLPEEQIPAVGLNSITLTSHIDADISKGAVVESVLTVENLHLNSILREKIAAVSEVLDDDNNKGVTIEAVPAIEGIRVSASDIISLAQPTARHQILDDNENTASNNIAAEFQALPPTKEPYLHVSDAVSHEELDIQNENLTGDAKSSSVESELVPTNEIEQLNGFGARAQERAVDEASKEAALKGEVLKDSELSNVDHEAPGEEGTSRRLSQTEDHVRIRAHTICDPEAVAIRDRVARARANMSRDRRRSMGLEELANDLTDVNIVTEQKVFEETVEEVTNEIDRAIARRQAWRSRLVNIVGGAAAETKGSAKEDTTATEKAEDRMEKRLSAILQAATSRLQASRPIREQVMAE